MGQLPFSTGNNSPKSLFYFDITNAQANQSFRPRIGLHACTVKLSGSIRFVLFLSCNSNNSIKCNYYKLVNVGAIGCLSTMNTRVLLHILQSVHGTISILIMSSIRSGIVSSSIMDNSMHNVVIALKCANATLKDVSAVSGWLDLTLLLRYRHDLGTCICQLVLSIKK